MFFTDDLECPNFLCARPWEQRVHWKNCSPLRIPVWSFIHPNPASYLLSEKVPAGVSWDGRFCHFVYWPPLLASQGHSASCSAFHRLATWKIALVHFIQSVLNLTRSLMANRKPNFRLHFIGTGIILLQIASAEHNEEGKQPSMMPGGICVHSRNITSPRRIQWNFAEDWKWMWLQLKDHFQIHFSFFLWCS